MRTALHEEHKVLFDGYLIKHLIMKKTALIINNLLFDGYLMNKAAILFDWKFYSHPILNIKH